MEAVCLSPAQYSSKRLVFILQRTKALPITLISQWFTGVAELPKYFAIHQATAG
jgi:hypothetical protein